MNMLPCEGAVINILPQLKSKEFYIETRVIFLN